MLEVSTRDPPFVAKVIDDLLRHFRFTSSLLLEEQALRLRPDRARRRYFIFEAARGFAPLACREAVRLWEAEAPSAAATRHLLYWRGVCEFLPSDAAVHFTKFKMIYSLNFFLVGHVLTIRRTRRVP